MAGQYRFKDQNGNIVAQISASVEGAIAFSGSVVDFTQANNVILGNVQLAGTASNALLLDGFDSQAFAFTSSIHPFTASIAGTNTFTSSATARLNSIETISASNVSRLNALEAKTGSLATTGSNTFIGTQTITGSLYISSDLIVQGSSSLQNITASAVSIGTNIVNLNTANPAIRYAGLSIGDSGSIGSSGSFLYDSVQDEMIFVHRGANTTVTSSVVLMGPQTYDNIGNETYPTANRIQKGTGNEHLIDSCIIDDGTTVCVNANLRGSSTISGTSLRSNGVGTFGFNTANNGEFQIYGTALDGMIMAGRGSSNDMVITNKNGSDVFRIPTGTIISNFIGNVCAPSFVLANGNCITSIRNTGGAVIGVLGFTSGTDTLFIKGGTSGAAASIQFQDTGGTMATFYNCRLGIGTVTPGTALEVVSRAADADRTIPHNVLTLTAEQGNAPYGFFGGAILFKNRSYTSGLVESARIRSVIYDDGAPYNCGGGLWFETTSTPGGTLTPSLAINYEGRVSIGTQTPVEPLTVSFAAHGLISQHRQSCGVGVGQNFYMKFNNVVGSPVSYAGIYADIAANTNGAHSGRMILQVANNGSLSSAVTIANTGITTFSNTICSPQFTGGFVCAVGGLNARGASTTWSTFNFFGDNPGGAGAQCNTVLAGSIVGCSGWGPQLRFSGASGFIDIGQDCNGGFVVETSDTPRLNITQNGTVLVNAQSALAAGRIASCSLQVTNEVYSRGPYGGYFWEDRSNSTYWYGWYATGNTTIYLWNGAIPGNIASINPSNGSYTALSDVNKKKDIETSTIGLNAIMCLRPTLYRMKTENENCDKHLGFIAQEVQPYIPQAYSETDNDDCTKFIGLNDRAIIATLVKGMQEQQCMIDTLKSCLGIS